MSSNFFFRVRLPSIALRVACVIHFHFPVTYIQFPKRCVYKQVPPNEVKIVSVKGNEDNFVKVWNITFQISMNVPSIQTAVMLMRTVQTPKEHSSARVIRDTLEMESHALVSST